MKRQMRFLLFLSCCLLPGFSFAKENKDLVKARYYYHQFAYYLAIPYYEKAAGQVADAVLYAQLADCYLVTDQLNKAAGAYEKAVQAAGCPAAVVLRYGGLLMELGRYDEAEKWLSKYLEKNNKDVRARNMLAGCHQAKSVISAIPEGVATFLDVNTDGSDFAPALWKGKLVFVSDSAIGLKKKTDYGTGNAFYSIYMSAVDSNGQVSGQISRLTDSRKQNIRYHDGPCTFSADGKQMFFTRTTYNDQFFRRGSVPGKDSIVTLQIMIASGYDSIRKKFEQIAPFIWNNKEYAVQHPAVSPNGQVMAFSSNMPGGAGGSDIYLSYNVNGAWSKPLNAGPLVNTEGEEVFPFWSDNGTLYFSSDGHPGLGGLDIYRCHYDGLTHSFSDVILQGAPVNSGYDDITLAVTGAEGIRFFSSNRPAEKKWDNIYAFRQQKVYLELEVTDSLTGLPLAAWLQLADNGSRIADTLASRFLTQLWPERGYSIRVGKEGYLSREINFTAVCKKRSDTIFFRVKLIPLQPPPVEPVAQVTPAGLLPHSVNIMDTPGIKTFEINKIYEVGHFYYDFNKYELTEEHKVFLDSMLTQLKRHPTMRIEVRAHTDCRGSFEFNRVLSDNRALSVVNYLVKHGINRTRLKYKGLGFTQPTVACPVCEQCTEAEHNLNRLLEFKVLQL